MKLSEVRGQRKVRVTALHNGHAFMHKMSSRGIRVGSVLEIVTCNPLCTPIVVRVGNSTYTIGWGEADKIEVEEVK